MRPYPPYHRALPAPLRYTDEHGVQRLHGRRQGFVLETRDDTGRQRLHLYCPELHRVDLDGLPVDERRPIRCSHRPDRVGDECGIVMLLVGGLEARGVVIGDLDPGEELVRLISTIEVTADELHWMADRRLRTVPEMLHYLNLVWTRRR